MATASTSELVADDDVEYTDELRAQALRVVDDAYRVVAALARWTSEER